MAIDNAARAMAVQGGRVLTQSAVAVSHTGNTVETTLATVTIPAGAMGANGQLVVEALFSMAGAGGTRTPRIKLGATVVAGAAAAVGTLSWNMHKRIANRGAANSQVFYAAANTSDYSASGVANATAAENTANALALTFTGQLAVGTDTITLESYIVWLFPKA